MAGATFSWTYDAPSGVFKNHALSGELLKLAALDFKLVPFTKKVTEFQKGMGESVTLLYFKSLTQPSSAQLDEKTRIPIDQLTMGTQTITIAEWGRGVEYTDLFKQLSKYDPSNPIQERLKDQMDEAMDNAVGGHFTGSDVKLAFTPTTLTGGTWATDGTSVTTALVNLTKDHLSLIRDYMRKDIHVPPFEGDHYIGIFSTKALRGLRNDRTIEAWNMYLRKGDHIYKGEVGRVEDIRAVEIMLEGALSNSVGSSGVLGEGAVFGKDAVARIEIEFPHLRAQPNYTADFGRRHAVAWYGIVNFGVYFPTATDREARIVKIVSA
jgi:N4-gp56 family major capsid protein